MKVAEALAQERKEPERNKTMTKSTSLYPARTVAERLADQKKLSKEHAELAAAYRERTGQLGPIRFVD